MPPFEIGIDARMIRHTGIGTYLRGILRGFRSEFSAISMPVLFCSSTEMIPEGSRFERFDAPIYSLKEQKEYLRLVPQCRLWHAPHYNIPLYKGRTKLVVTIHDLIHWIFRKEYFGIHQAFYAWLMMSRAVASADEIITVSEHTRTDLVKHFRADPSRISVIYEAVDESFAPKPREEIQSALKKYGIDGSYFLYVGSLKPHKNLLWLVRLIRELRGADEIRSRLVIVGKKDKRYRRKSEELAALETDLDLIYLPHLDDGDLPALYSGAVALVHPSLYEGFGLTPLEAMACGTAVIAAKNASIPEVCGDGACLVDSCSNHAMMQAIIRAEKDAAFRRNLQERGRVRVNEFSWAVASRKTAQVYEKALGRS